MAMDMSDMLKVESADPVDGFMWIHESDFDPEVHTKFDTPDDHGTVEDYEWTKAPNGYWSIEKDGEEVASGRGQETLDEALDALQ